ncbi:hypothetical protein M3Y94_00473400 [Aphelenchoides besseyi]|nr:hypothetical protein M3Y94_00473400 [Aphelenchoides besseyi]KAI6219950.1 hypothetical protein M3Y95_01081800 [Aphelenchoides besseyi]
MPPSARVHAETAIAVVSPLLTKRTTNGAVKSKADNFEELAFRTLQALNPNRRIKRAEVSIERVRHLLERLLRGDTPADVLNAFSFPTRRSTSTGSNSSSSGTSTSHQLNDQTKRQISPPLVSVNKKTTTTTWNQSLETIKENTSTRSVGDLNFRPSGFPSSFSTKRRESIDEHSTAESTVDEDVEENKVPSAFDLLFERSLEKSSALESAHFILKEVEELDLQIDSESVELNQKLLAQLNSQPLRNEIDPRRSAEKNVQSVEVKVLLELYKLRLASDSTVNLQQTKLIPTLRYLNIITGGAHLVDFVKNVVEPEFEATLPVALQQLRERLCVEMPEPLKSFSPVDVADLPPHFVVPSLNSAAIKSADSTDPLDNQTKIPRNRRRRSNASTASSASTLSSVVSSIGLPVLDRFSAANSVVNSKRTSLAETAPVLLPEPADISTQRSTRSSLRRKDSNGTTTSSDDQPPVLRPMSLRSSIDVSVKEEAIETEKRTSKRKITTSMVKLEEDVETNDEDYKVVVKRSRKVESKGSIASRRQSNRRLCVIRQNVKDLILPTSRRSSTASLLQKQQPARRSLIQRYAGQVEKSQLSSAQQSATLDKRTRLSSKENANEELKSESTKRSNKAKAAAKQPLTPDVLNHYRQRMSNLYESAKQMDEHEVFYGRRNGRVDLFESEIEDASGTNSMSPPESAPTEVKVRNKKKSKNSKSTAESQRRQQKNRSGRSVKQTSTDCLYIAHSLLNVHNRDPLASDRPRPSQLSNGAFAFGGDLKSASTDGQPFRVKRLLKHANRAKVLTLRRYLQRSQQQQLLLQIKKEKMDEDE